MGPEGGKSQTEAAERERGEEHRSSGFLALAFLAGPQSAHSSFRMNRPKRAGLPFLNQLFKATDEYGDQALADMLRLPANYISLLDALCDMVGPTIELEPHTKA